MKRSWIAWHPAVGVACMALLLLAARVVIASPSALEIDRPVKLEVPTDGDWITLTARAPEDGAYLVRTRGTADTYMIVFDGDGRYLGSSDDVFGLDAAVALPMRAGGVVTIEISLAPGAINRPQKATTSVLFSRLDVPVAPAKVGGSARGSIAPGQPARFRFEAPLSGRLLAATRVTDNLDTVLAVYDDRGVLVALNDDRSPQDASSAAVVRVESGREYECFVTGFNAGAAGDFVLELSPVASTGTDDYPDHATDPALRIFPVPVTGLAVEGEWETWDDADVVDLSFKESGLYRLTSYSRFDSTLTVYDAVGRPVRADDDSGPGLNGMLLVDAELGERLRARLRPLSSLDRGRWRLTVQRVGRALPSPISRSIGPGRVHALAVGAADYPSPKALVDIVTDVWNFRRFMIGSLGAREEDVRILLDDLDSRDDDLTVPRIRAEIAALADRVGPGDTVFFLYSGHGSAPGGRSSIAPEARSYPDVLLRRDLDLIRAARVVVLIDACNSGGFLDSLAAPNRWVLASSQVEEGSNASRQGQPEKTGGSLFMACLMQELMYRWGVQTLGEAFARAGSVMKRVAPGQYPRIYEPELFRLDLP